MERHVTPFAFFWTIASSLRESLRQDTWHPNVVSFSNCMKTCEKCSYWQAGKPTLRTGTDLIGITQRI